MKIYDTDLKYCLSDNKCKRDSYNFFTTEKTSFISLALVGSQSVFHITSKNKQTD